MKKKILYIAALFICLSSIYGGTFAYFTATDTARNVITSGGIDVRIIEQQMVDGVLLPYTHYPIQILPATSVSKIVSVQNMEQSAWVRMKYTVTVYDENGEKMEISADKLKKEIIIEPDSDQWILEGDWWYYRSAIQSGEMTKPLFEEIVFSGLMDNRYQNCTMTIDVTAQAVQKANNGSFVNEALGWPEN